MKKNILRGAYWGGAFLLLAFSDEILGRFNIEPTAQPRVLGVLLALWCAAPVVWKWATAIKQNWHYKAPQLRQALEATWDKETREVVLLVAGIELIVGGLVATYNVEGSLLLKASQFVLAIALVNIIMLSIWLAISAEQIKEAEAATNNAAKG